MNYFTLSSIIVSVELVLSISLVLMLLSSTCELGLRFSTVLYGNIFSRFPLRYTRQSREIFHFFYLIFLLLQERRGPLEKLFLSKKKIG